MPLALMKKEQALIDLFGKSFSDAVVDGSSDSEEAQFASKYGVAIEERFVEDIFKVDIRRSMDIDCEVIQRGFRPSLLRDMLSRHCPLLRRRSLHFFVVNAASFRDCVFYWKVRNCGEAASEAKFNVAIKMAFMMRRLILLAHIMLSAMRLGAAFV